MELFEKIPYLAVHMPKETLIHVEILLIINHRIDRTIVPNVHHYFVHRGLFQRSRV